MKSLCITMGGDRLYSETHGGRLSGTGVRQKTHLPIQSLTLAKGELRDQTIPIASPVEQQNVLGQLDAICDCLDMNQGL